MERSASGEIVIQSKLVEAFPTLQDGVIGHLADEHPLVVGRYVPVGHGAVTHACADWRRMFNRDEFHRFGWCSNW